jgi:hypothetical protein
MSDTLNYLDCWTLVATSLFSQALVGEPALSEALPKPMLAGSFGFAAQLEGDEEGRFSVMLDGALAEAGLLGDGVDQKEGWAELLREVCDAAVGELLAKTGRKARIKSFAPIEAESKLSRAFQRNPSRQGRPQPKDRLLSGNRLPGVQQPAGQVLHRWEGAAGTMGQPRVGHRRRLQACLRDWNCCSMSNWRRPYALAPRRCPSAKFSILVQAMSCNWIATFMTPSTCWWATRLSPAVRSS